MHLLPFNFPVDSSQFPIPLRKFLRQKFESSLGVGNFLVPTYFFSSTPSHGFKISKQTDSLPCEKEFKVH